MTRAKEDMKHSKAFSERSLVAHLLLGWEIASVSCDRVTDTVSEHLLKSEAREDIVRPTYEDLFQVVQLSNIEDKFVIEGRGTIITPGLPREKAGILRTGDPIVIMDYRLNAIVTRVYSLEFSSPSSPKGWAILLPTDVKTDQVLIGMQVWAKLPDAQALV